MKGAAISALRRRGWYLPHSARSVWFHGDDIETFSAAELLLAGARRRWPQYRMVLTAPPGPVQAWVASRFRDDAVLPIPQGNGAAARFLEALRPRALVRLDRAAALPAALRAAAEARGVVPIDLAVLGSCGDADRIEKIAARLPPPPPETAGQQGWRVKTRLDRLADTGPGRRVAAARSARRIDSWPALRARLGSPRTILCLGNGPSSEDPALGEVTHDVLFRVNWRWKQRPLLTHPDVVFVGDPRTVQHLRGAVLAFGAKEWERTMLLRHLLALHLRPPEFFTIERLPTLLQERSWWARPTNGALMILAAAALNPERLVIAGMDLFQHPAGRYPGDTQSTNHYAQVHRRDVDLEVIRGALRAFPGEVRVIGEALARALREAE